jgi:dihydroxyacetone kinase-like protein
MEEPNLPMSDALTFDLTRAIIYEITASMAKNADYLTQLDKAIGDGDHGRNMLTGFQSVQQAIAPLPPGTPGILLRSAGMTLVTTVGGASGPLYSTAFIAAAIAAHWKEALQLVDLAHMARSAAEALARRGRCRLGDKTILDALDPAARALAAAAEDNKSLLYGLQAAADAARQGMEATTPMVARCGLAMQYGPGSAGHQDPGATSCYLMFDAAVRTFRQMCPQAR